MKYFKALLFVSLLLSPISYAADQTEGGIPLSTKWKKDLYAFAKTNVKHSIWGLPHSERNYREAMALARDEGLAVDEDVLFVAAFLHDIGAIEPFRIQGLEHSIRSVQVVEPLLKSYGLSETKIAKVRETILAHMYDADLFAKSPEAIVFHDADTLDFLGDIGIIRIVGLTDRHAWAPNLMGSLATLRGWETELPPHLITKAAKRIASLRIQEMDSFWRTLSAYSVQDSF